MLSQVFLGKTDKYVMKCSKSKSPFVNVCMDYRYNINIPTNVSKICWSQHVKCVSVDTLTKNQVADFVLVRTKHEFMMEIASSHCENSTKSEVFPFTATLPL